MSYAIRLDKHHQECRLRLVCDSLPYLSMFQFRFFFFLVFIHWQISLETGLSCTLGPTSPCPQVVSVSIIIGADPTSCLFRLDGKKGVLRPPTSRSTPFQSHFCTTASPTAPIETGGRCAWMGFGGRYDVVSRRWSRDVSPFWGFRKSRRNRT